MRQFLAVTPGRAALEALAGLVERLRPAARGWRWVRPEGMHLTLRFLGEVDSARDDAARPLWRAAAAAATRCTLRAEGLDAFPGRRRPRVLVVPVVELGGDGRLATLARELERSARDLGFAPEERGFRPHLTLARAERKGRPVFPEGVAFAPFEFPVERLHLVRSELSPGGARYTVLESFAMGAGAPSTFEETE